jgi:hypothetical protein
MTVSESIDVAKLSNENQFIDDEYETERVRNNYLAQIYVSVMFLAKNSQPIEHNEF